MKNKKIIIMFIVIAVIVMVIGTSFAFFNYTKTGNKSTIIVGDIYLKEIEGQDEITLVNVFPETKEEARSRDDNFITFTLSGINTSDKTIYYEIDLKRGVDKVSPYVRFNDSDLVFDLVELDENDNEINYVVDAKSYSDITNKKIWVDTIASGTNTEINKKYKLRAWLSDTVTISDTDSNATYEASDFKNRYATIKVGVFGDFNEKELDISYLKVYNAIQKKINAEENACNPIWVDDMETANDESDDITYFSGTNDCVDMNYVWYSGKLWRIVAIYPDGRMKLVTEDALSAIFWGSTSEYDGSWAYQWLSEDFYDTLVNPNDILVDDIIWNYSIDANGTPVRPESIATQKTKEAPVGLLNVYEYYNAYRNASTSTNYLNIGYFWWLITLYSTSNVRNITYNGTISSSASSSGANGIRPSIVIKSDIEFIGKGTKTNPYKIKGDMENSINNVTLLSSRSIGEYVKFDNDIYRIVSIDEISKTTKLTRVDYLRDNETVITKNFASSAYFGKSSNTQDDTYWDYYLNNNWYNNISQTYKNMLVDGTYYLGLYPNNKNYKATICKGSASALDSTTIKNCTKYTDSDTDKTFTGKVGLPRVGEMFATQLGAGYLTSSSMWSITPYSASNMRNISNLIGLELVSISSNTYGVRPSIVIKSGIKITNGTGYVGGETNSPFEISE